MPRSVQSKNVLEQSSDNISINSVVTVDSNVQNLSLDLDGTELIDESVNYSLFTVASFDQKRHISVERSSSESSSDSFVTVQHITSSDLQFLGNYLSCALFVKMSNHDDAAATFMLKYKKCLLQWDDIYRELDLTVTSFTEKKELFANLKAITGDLQDVQLWFELHPYAAFTPAAHTKLVDLRTQAAEMIKSFRISLNEDLLAMDTPRHTPVPTPTPTPTTHEEGEIEDSSYSKSHAAVAAVLTAVPFVTSTCNQLVNNYKVIPTMKSKSMSEFKAMEAELDNLTSDFKDTISQLDNIEKKAVTGGWRIL